MDKKALAQLLSNPRLVQTTDQGELEKLVAAYPWFSTSYLLLTKKYQLAGSSDLEQKIAYSSAFANDRQALYQLLYETAAKENAPVQEVAAPIVEEKIVAVPEEVVKEEIKAQPVAQVLTGQPDDSSKDISEEFILMSESGSAAELSPALVGEVEEEDWVEDHSEPEVEAIQELEQEFIRHELNESLKENEVNSMSQSEFNHKDEEDEPEDERYFEERFDTELEAIKTIDLHTSHKLEKEQEAKEWKAPAPLEEEKPKEEKIIAAEKSPLIEKVEKPAEVPTTRGEKHTFSDWLSQFGGTVVARPEPKAKPEETAEPKAQSAKVAEPEASADLLVGEFTPDYLSADAAEDLKTIDRFVESMKEKGEEKKQKEVSVQNLAMNSLLENDEILTETLAKIYEKQGKKLKAIQTYEKLSLKFPEKAAYFSAMIQKLKNDL